MKKYLITGLFCLVLAYSLFGLSKFEYKKIYSPEVFGGGKEKITIDDDSLQNSLILNNVQTHIHLYRDMAVIKSYYYLANTNKTQDINFTFSYPCININFSQEKQTLNDKLDVVNVTNYDTIIESSYSNFKMSVDGVDEPYVKERSVIVETNIPFKYGNESLIRNEDGVYTSEEVDSYIYLYGWYHLSMSIEPRTKKTVCVSYSVPLYQNVITVYGNLDSSFEDPALHYDYIDIPCDFNGFTTSRRMHSEKVFSFYNYVPYESQVKAKKRTISFISHLIDDNFIKLSSLKGKKVQKSYTLSYKSDNFIERDNVYAAISDMYVDNCVPIYYFDNRLPIIHTENKGVFYKLTKDNPEIILKYNPQNKRQNSSLMPKRDYINVKQIRILANGLAKTTKTTFEISLSNSETFENSIKKTVHVSLPEYNENVVKNGYFVLFDDDAPNVKYIKIKVVPDQSGQNIKPIMINGIEILQ